MLCFLYLYGLVIVFLGKVLYFDEINYEKQLPNGLLLFKWQETHDFAILNILRVVDMIIVL